MSNFKFLSSTSSQHETRFMEQLNIRDILASCPKNPTRASLPLPEPISALNPDVFVTFPITNEPSPDNNTGLISAKDFPLFSPILYSAFSDEDFDIMRAPIAVPHLRKHVNTQGGDRQNYHQNNFAHKYQKNQAQGNSPFEFVTQRSGGRRLQGQRGNAHHHINKTPSAKNGFHYSNHPKSQNTRHQSEQKSIPKKSMDSFISQFESLAPYKTCDMDTEDPWADLNSSIGSFDDSGNFISNEKPAPVPQRTPKIPIQQSRLSSIMSSKIITAESLEATLIQNNTKSEGESSLPVPFFNLWYYKDPSGNIQGPFPSEQMSHWSEAGYFDMKMLVRPDIESTSSPNNLEYLSIISDFVPLGEWVKLYNNHLPWSYSARNIIYSVYSPMVNLKDAPPTNTLSPCTQISTLSMSKPQSIQTSSNRDNSISELSSEHLQSVENSELEEPATRKPKPYAAITPTTFDQTPSTSMTTFFKGWNTSNKIKSLENHGEMLEKASKNQQQFEEDQNLVVKNNKEAKPSSKPTPSTWSSIASFGKPSTQKESSDRQLPMKKESPSTVSNVLKAPVVTQNPSPVVCEASVPASLEKWVATKLCEMNIKNVDSTTLTNLFYSLSLDQMKDIVSGFINDAKDAEDFCAEFIQARSDPIFANSNILSSSKKKTTSHESDGFSIVSRKPKKTSAKISNDTKSSIPTRRIVGL